MKELVKKEIIAFQPSYEQDKGDCTKILLQSGETVVIEKSIVSFIKCLYKENKISYLDSKEYYSKLLLVKSLLPLVINSNNVFMPFKSRIPLKKNDRAFGYVNYKAISDLCSSDNESYILLNNSTKIPCLSSLDRLSFHYVKAVAAQQEIKVSESKDETSKFLDKFTRAGIELILEEIQKLKN